MRKHAMYAAIGFAGVFLLATPAAFSQQFQPRMGEPVPGLTPAQLQRFVDGRTEFQHIITVSEGVGPTFNDTACSGCHLAPVAGGSSDKFVTRFGKAASGSTPFDPLDGTGPSGLDLGGSLLQLASINGPTCDEVVPAIADVVIHRITPPTFGFGLIDAIDDADILFWEAFPPPGISGEAHMVQPLEGPPGLRVGRFGWKAQVATVLSFSGDASLNEQGLTNRLVGSENAPNGDMAKLALCDSVPDPEDFPDPITGLERIDRQTDFQRFLAPPPQTPKSGMSGEGLFNAVGCGGCHVTSAYTTKTVAEAALSQKTIKPYSDFLLHDMGALGDGIVQGMANEQEFRTPPLWGLKLRGEIALLHDGRANGGGFAANVASAVGSHDGEAAASRAAFNALSVSDKDKLTAFLASLGQAEFDIENDNDVDAVDWFFLLSAFTGPGSFFTPDSPSAIADVDQDGDFDLADFAVWQRANTN